MQIRGVHDPAFTKVSAADKPHIHQQLQGTVNGGKVERLAASMDRGEDFFGAHMMITVSNRFHDHLPLGRNPAAMLA
jgi:hypothetical protein